MGAIRFPQINFPFPTKLREATNRLRDFDVEPLEGQLENLWELFLEKLRNKSEISNGDRLIGLMSPDLIPKSLLPQYIQAFQSNITFETFDKLSSRFFETLTSTTTLDLILKMSPKLRISSKFPSTLNLLEERGMSCTLENLSLIIANHEDPIEAIFELRVDRDLPIFSKGQEFVIHELVRRGPVKGMLEITSNRIFQFLSSGFEDGKVGCEVIDRMLGLYLHEHPAWQTEVLSNSKTIGRFINWYKSTNTNLQNNLQRLGAVQEILRQYALLLEVLKDLEEVEKERGDYWRQKLELCTFVLPKKFKKSDAKVGVAFGLGEYVVVEMAPKGNAAYLYLATDFHEKIKSTENWKVPALGQNYTNLTSSTGQIKHMLGWQSKFNSLLNAIKS